MYYILCILFMYLMLNYLFLLAKLKRAFGINFVFLDRAFSKIVYYTGNVKY